MTEVKGKEPAENKLPQPLYDRVKAVLDPFNNLIYYTLESNGSVTVKPRRYLGETDFAALSKAVQSLGAKYVSEGKNTHWIIGP